MGGRGGEGLHLFGRKQRKFILYSNCVKSTVCELEVKTLIKIALCCVLMNKCSLYSTKQNAKASRKMLITYE